MAMFSGLPAVRDDFRCSLCRQKHAFHCEHDTPYRDQLLGTYDQDKPVYSNARGSHRTGAQKRNISANDHRMQMMTNDRHEHSNAAARYEQNRRTDHGSLTHTNGHGPLRTHEHKKKKKSCVIL